MPSKNHSPDYIVLASTSPRRRQFVAALDIPFTIIAPGAASGSHEIDETPLPNEPPARLVQRLSVTKAQAVIAALPTALPHWQQYQRLIVIAADTEVALNEQTLGKPATPAAAGQMLTALRAQPHEVLSGLTVARPAPNSEPPQLVTRLHRSRIWMRPYTNAEIATYVAGGSPLDKAGAYGIQDDSFAPVSRLDGCFASVMGFPLAELAQALPALGLRLPPVTNICTRLIGQPCCQT